MSKSPSSKTGKSGPGAPEGFSERPAWQGVGDGWRPLFGDYRSLGFSFEWHDFTSGEELEWSKSFHPGSVELCLNLDGRGTLLDSQRTVVVGPRMTVFYCQGEPPLRARRSPGERQRFVTVEFSAGFLKRHLGDEARHLHPWVREVVEQGARESMVSIPEPITTAVLHLLDSLQQCPVFKSAQQTWFRCKALELASQLFFRPPDGELFCTRQQRGACERAARVRGILVEHLADPPTLEALGRLVGCSPFHLSRQFSDATGMTIQQFLRQARLERAAELLRSGAHNVTEAAMEVGYSSLSHFSVAFREMFGCCPGLYPLRLSSSSAGAAASGPGTGPRRPR